MSHEFTYHNQSSTVVLILPSLVIPALTSRLVVSNIAWYTEFRTVLFLYNQGRDEIKICSC